MEIETVTSRRDRRLRAARRTATLWIAAALLTLAAAAHVTLADDAGSLGTPQPSPVRVIGVP
ncbi:MAG: hypothetical protein OEY23_20560 [Acidimicrobiia bacterium]|nr:hypothetical protein [Acidimicrobiia bacterium]